jgi:hypothetical protein
LYRKGRGLEEKKVVSNLRKYDNYESKLQILTAIINQFVSEQYITKIIKITLPFGAHALPDSCTESNLIKNLSPNAKNLPYSKIYSITVTVF